MSLPLRKDALHTATTLGLEGEAAELFARAGAPARHAARVEAARIAALTWAGVTDLEGVITLEQLASAYAACAFDVHGIGGPRNAGGDGCATTRHPAFAGCGKGRKQADDGPAWTAAIDEASKKIAMVLDGVWASPLLTLFADGSFVLALRDRSIPLADRAEESAHRESWARSIIIEAATAEGNPDAVRGAGIVVNRAHEARLASEFEASRDMSYVSHLDDVG